MSLTDYLLIIFVILYISGVFVGRTLIVRKKIKKFPITYGRTGSAHDFLGWVFMSLIVLSLISPVVYASSEQFYQYLLPLKAFEIVGLQIFGIILAYASMVWTIVAQSQMGVSWRIGIDESQKTELVQKGLFRYSRHPIYLGVMITSLSLFFVMPNMLTLAVSLMTFLTIAIQARLEEEYLTKVYGQDFLSYRQKTPRWLVFK